MYYLSLIKLRCKTLPPFKVQAHSFCFSSLAEALLLILIHSFILLIYFSSPFLILLCMTPGFVHLNTHLS